MSDEAEKPAPEYKVGDKVYFLQGYNDIYIATICEIKHGLRLKEHFVDELVFIGTTKYSKFCEDKAFTRIHNIVGIIDEREQNFDEDSW